MELKIKILLGLLVLTGLAFAYWVVDTDGGFEPYDAGTCFGEGPSGNFSYDDVCLNGSNILMEYFPNGRYSCGYELYECWECLDLRGPDACEWIGK